VEATLKILTKSERSFWARFARHWSRFFFISVALLVPVFWHRRIEAGDLPSHLYNTWLAQLIRQGQAPGLWIARQWNNVLFDYLLSGLASAFGLWAAERMAVSIAVLTFFWGAFTLISVTTLRSPWSLVPLLAVVAYGWTFEMGFMNYYIALALSFLVLAAFWRGGTGLRLLSLCLLPLIWLAHPLGLIYLASFTAYIALTKLLQPRYHIYLLLAAGICLSGVRIFLARRYKVTWTKLGRYFIYNGADQMTLYGRRYHLLYALFGAILLAALAADALARRRDESFWDAWWLPLQLYLAAGMASVLLPSLIWLPQYPEPLSYLTARLSSVLIILQCWMLGAIKPRKWHAAGYALIAIGFFTFLYIDTGTVNGMEEQVERAIAALPPSTRVVVEIGDMSRVVIEHIVDRACIGRCFSYKNYEPKTAQFRVRAMSGNSIVTSQPPREPDGAFTEELVKALGPPVFEILECEGSSVNVCVRELSANDLRDLVEGNMTTLNSDRHQF